MDLSLRAGLRLLAASVYCLTLAALYPINLILARLRRHAVHPNSVLHVSYMVHIPYYTTRILRRHGWRADYLAIGASPVWDKYDYHKPNRWRADLALREFVLFWRVVAKYEIVHLHFMITMSVNGWELPILKRMGRKVIAHWRGCEIRDRERNMALHPEINICQKCDYNATICRSTVNARRRDLAARFADHVLVTTPDMRDFVPEAEHFPFFAPEDLPPPRPRRDRGLRRFKIVHVTVHPGIEGTDEIAAAIAGLRARGHDIDFVFLRMVPHERVLAELADADLAIGKMKMGYYANAQIESMALGVPTVTYVRPEFMTRELEESGFIFASLSKIEETLDFYLRHPEALERKRHLARESILRLHDNDVLARRMIGIYDRLKAAP